MPSKAIWRNFDKETRRGAINFYGFFLQRLDWATIAFETDNIRQGKKELSHAKVYLGYFFRYVGKDIDLQKHAIECSERNRKMWRCDAWVEEQIYIRKERGIKWPNAL